MTRVQRKSINNARGSAVFLLSEHRRRWGIGLHVKARYKMSFSSFTVSSVLCIYRHHLRSNSPVGRYHFDVCSVHLVFYLSFWLYGVRTHFDSYSYSKLGNGLHPAVEENKRRLQLLCVWQVMTVGMWLDALLVRVGGHLLIVGIWVLFLPYFLSSFRFLFPIFQSCWRGNFIS
jgi:hypothetical protein